MSGFERGRALFQILARNDLEAIHSGTLEVLETAGIRIQSEVCLNLLEAAGGTVDRKTGAAHIPEGLVEEALKKRQRDFRLCARNPKYDIELGAGHVHLTTDGNMPSVLDFETGKRRSSTSADLAIAGKVANALDEAHIFWPPVSSQDYPEHIRHVADLKVSLESIEKHVQVETTSFRREAEWLAALGAALVGGEKELRKRPIFSSMHCPFSPLILDAGSTEGALALARAGIPICFYGMPQAGISGPVTLAGSLVVNNTEVLAGLTLAQLEAPGSAVFYGTGGAVFDMRTMTWAGGSPERGLISAAAGELAHYYGMPILCGGIVTSAKLPGPQACYEKVISGVTQFLSGCDMVAGLGALDDVSMFSLEELVLDGEMARQMARLSQGIAVDPEHLAIELIEQVGPGGNFLSQRHTMRHLRSEHFLCELTDRRTAEAWEADGRKSVVDRAREKVRRILAETSVAPPAPEATAAMAEVFKRAEGDLRVHVKQAGGLR